MKTNEEILERYQSHDTIDVFNIQKDLLLSLLPFEVAKPYLNAEYVADYDNLPEDEKWSENFDAGEQILLFLPLMHKLVSKDNFVEIKKGILALKTFIWASDDEFYKEVEPFFSEYTLDELDDFLKKVSKHYGYTPIIEDVEFEEIPD